MSYHGSGREGKDQIILSLGTGWRLAVSPCSIIASLKKILNTHSTEIYVGPRSAMDVVPKTKIEPLTSSLWSVITAHCLGHRSTFLNITYMTCSL